MVEQTINTAQVDGPDAGQEEDDFQMIIPEFGVCGAEADGQGDDEETKDAGAQAKGKAATKGGEGKAAHVEQSSPQQEEAKTPLKNACYKCKEKPAKFQNKQDTVCWECLENMLVHRFKNAITRHCGIQKDYPNLVAISGGSNSMAMLHFLYNCLGGNTSTKKMFFKIHVLYIEEGPAVYGWSPELIQQHRQLIAQTCERYQFAYTIVPLESVFDIKQDFINKVASPEELNSEIYKAFHQNLPVNACTEVADIDQRRQHLGELIGSLDAAFAADLCLYLKKWLIADFCLNFNFKRVLLATTGHSIATKLIGAIAKGRGASIYNEVAYFDDKNFGGRVSFCNPMKEFLQKEIAIFNHKNQVQIIAQKSLA